MCWLLSVYGVASVCAKYDLHVSKRLSFIFEHGTSRDEFRRGICWMLSVYGVASVCAKYELLVSKILSFILNILQVRTSSDEECVAALCIWGSVGLCKI